MLTPFMRSVRLHKLQQKIGPEYFDFQVNILAEKDDLRMFWHDKVNKLQSIFAFSIEILNVAFLQRELQSRNGLQQSRNKGAFSSGAMNHLTFWAHPPFVKTSTLKKTNLLSESKRSF